MLLGDRYELRDALGRGGMATVYRAWDTKLERLVAVKVFSQPGVGGEDRERRLREMRLLSGLSHPHLVTLFDAEWPEPSQAPDGMGGFLVMELVDGENLRRRIDREGADSALMTRLAGQLSGALAYLHGRGIVHRDLKPENILLTDAPGGGAVNAKLVDFGIAQLVGDERLTTAGTVLGTAAYLSPEQVTGQGFGPAADVYALGLVLLECLTGVRAYPGTSVESAVARLSRAPEIPADTPEPWRGLLTRMTDSDPAARPTAAEVSETTRDAPPAWPIAAAGAAGAVAAGAAAVAGGEAAAAAEPAADEAGRTRRYPQHAADPTAATERIGPTAAGAAAAGAAAGAADAEAAAASTPTAPTVAMTSAGADAGAGAGTTAPTSATRTAGSPPPPSRRRRRIIALVIAAVLVAAAIVVALVLWLGGSGSGTGSGGSSNSPAPSDSSTTTPSTSPSEGQGSTGPSTQPSEGGASQQPSQQPSQQQPSTQPTQQQPSQQPSATTAPTVEVTAPVVTPTG